MKVIDGGSSTKSWHVQKKFRDRQSCIFSLCKHRTFVVTTMTRAQRQKLERESTAAYSASQPLFDALRIGFIRVGEQKKVLSIARDIVQNLHVQIPNLDSKAEVDKEQRYTDCAVKAWRSATEIYADIFEALANVTAAVEEEGRAERDGHAMFAEMARTAVEARKAAQSFTLYGEVVQSSGTSAGDLKKKSKQEAAVNGGEVHQGSDDKYEDATSSSAALSGSEEKDELEEKPQVDPTPTNKILLSLLGKRPLPEEQPEKTPDEPPKKIVRYSDNIKYDAQGRKILWDKGAEKPNVPYGTMDSRAKKAWKAEKARQRREKEQQKRSERRKNQMAEQNARAGTNLIPEKRTGAERTNGGTREQYFISLNEAAAPEVGSTVETAAPPVQYEDASAEVDARLEAKAAKKEAAKKEKKRKRESGDSLASAVQEHNVEKAKKKKVKPVEDIEDGETLGKEKRKQEENGEGHSKKKRKKA